MKNINKKAFAVVEYAVLLVIVISAFVIMRTYIQRGLFGNWAQTGQSYAFGRQYDSPKTIDCAFDEQSNLWYDHNCFMSQSNADCAIGNTTCQEGIITNGTCNASYCEQLNNQALSS